MYWASRGVGVVRGHWGQQGCRGHQGVSGGIRVAGELEAQPHLAPVQGLSTPTGRGHWGPVGGVGVLGALGWQVDWEPDHIGPQSRVPAFPLVPLGE